MKKLLSVILILSMVMVNLIALPVGAAELSVIETGKYKGYYAISSAEDIALVAAMTQAPTNKFVLTDNIILPKTTNKSYIPAFSGTLDGNGFYIKIDIENNTASANAGFIEVAGEGTIINLTIKGNVNVTNSGVGVAAFCGNGTSAKKFEIKNCINEANVTAKSGSVAGFIGVGTQSGLIAVDCINKGNITNSSHRAAGIIGTQGKWTTVSGCVNYGTLSATGYIGGIVAQSNLDYTTVITNCINFGKLKDGGTHGRIGGILGTMENASCAITNCINAGEIDVATKSANLVGGICGYNKTRLTIKNCLNIGVIKYKGTDKVGPIYSNILDAKVLSGNYGASNNVYVSNDIYQEQTGATIYTTADAALDILNTGAAGTYIADEGSEFKYPMLAVNILPAEFMVASKLSEKYITGDVIDLKTAYKFGKPENVTFYANGKKIAEITDAPFETGYTVPSQCGLVSFAMEANYADGSKNTVNETISVVKNAEETVYVTKAGANVDSKYVDGIVGVNADATSLEITIPGLFDTVDFTAKENGEDFKFTYTYLAGKINLTPERELLSNAEYEIIISDTTLLEDEVTALGTEYTVMFTTSTHNYDVNDVKLVINNDEFEKGSDVTFKAGDVVTAKVEVKNTEAGKKTFKCFIVAYGDDNYVSSFNMTDGEIDAEVDSKWVQTGSVTLKSDKVKVKVFIWDDLVLKTPLADQIIFE